MFVNAWSRRALIVALSSLVLATVAGCNGVGEGSPCISTRDCTSAALLCDIDRAECVQCLADTDCFGADEICAGRRCQAIVRCSSSRQCPGQVCDTARGYCVDCVSTVDCLGDEQCNGDGYCEPPPPACESDRQCSALGLVCDTAGGVCVECLLATDCLGGRICSAEHTCVVASACSPGTVECADATSVRACGADGRWGAPATCPPGSTCTDGACTDGSCPGGCGVGETCEAGTCRCGVGPICAAAERCVSGVCTPVGCVGCRAGETCVGGSCTCGGGPVCLVGESCIGGNCEPDETCSPACPSGQTCVDGRCEAAACDSPCGLSPQCGCSGGQACDWSTDTTMRVCRPSGAAGWNEPCSADMPCAAGYSCAYGMCHRFCDSSAECGGGTSKCTLRYLNAGSPVAGTEMCTVSCNPLTAEGCQSGFGCRISAGTEGVATSCRGTGVSIPGILPCTDDSGCPVNQTCLVGSGECVNYCRVGQADCADAGVCTPLAGSPTFMGAVIGSCPAVGFPFPGP